MTQKEIQSEISFLENVIKRARTSLEKAPEGGIALSKCRGLTTYIWLSEDSSGKVCRKYLSKQNSKLIQDLIQKEYDKGALDIALRNLRTLQTFKEKYKPNELERYYDSLHVERRNKINPYAVPVSKKVEDWKKVQYKAKPFEVETTLFFTTRNEKVRSKSELLIANLLDRYNVPYRYECPLMLASYGIIYPDFAVINPRTGKEYIFEHFGLVGNPDYEVIMNRKLILYASNGYFFGENLIYTFETASSPLNTRYLEQIIKHYLT